MRDYEKLDRILGNLSVCFSVMFCVMMTISAGYLYYIYKYPLI